MLLVVVESPYAGDIDRNTRYARRAVRDSLERGEAPIASHLLYTQPGILKDNVLRERQWGIEAGLEWAEMATKHAFYVDYGISNGMNAALERCRRRGQEYEFRRIGINEVDPE